MPSTPWRSPRVLLSRPVPIPDGQSIRTINLLQAAVPLVRFSAVVLAFTAINGCYSKILDTSYNSISCFCLGWELAGSG